jgi:short-chain fatty acids transporter
LASVLSDWFERWFPDAFALALTAVVIIFAASVATGNSVPQTAQWFGAGFWDLVAFTMQMSMIIITGYAVATAPPVYAIVKKIAEIPRNGRSAAAFVGLFSMLASLLSWSFSLIFSGLLAREVARRVHDPTIARSAPRRISASAASGHSASPRPPRSSWPRPRHCPIRSRGISGVIPLSPDARPVQSLLIAGNADRRVDGVVLLLCAVRREARGMKEMGVSDRPATEPVGATGNAGRVARVQSAADHLHQRRWLRVPDSRSPMMSGAAGFSELNHYVFLFLITGLLLHWRPRSFVQAITAAVTPVGGVLIQYPLYAGSSRMMTESGNRHHARALLRQRVDHAHLSGDGRIYSAFLGLFIPSAGGKWLIEAPYMLDAAKTLHVHLGVGRPDVQRDRGTGEPHSPVLDAAARRHPRPQSARHRRLLDAAVRRARASRVVPRVGVELHTHVHASGNSLRRAG